MKESSYKISFRENLSLHVWENRPESPCAAVLLCHGSTWHSGYFRKLGRELASRNILVVAFDFPGHGLSDSVTPDAPRGLVLDFDKDLVEALLVVRQKVQWPRRAAFYVLGESGGGAVVVRALQLGLSADGIILVGAALRMSEKAIPAAPMRWLIQRMAPMFPTMAMRVGNEPSLDKNRFLGRFGDQNAAEEAWKDPLVLKCMMLGTIASLLRVMPLLTKKKFKEIRIPLYIAHGANDTFVDVSTTREFYAAANSHDKILDIVPDARHKLLHDKVDKTKDLTERLGTWMIQRSIAV